MYMCIGTCTRQGGCGGVSAARLATESNGYYSLRITQTVRLSYALRERLVYVLSVLLLEVC